MPKLIFVFAPVAQSAEHNHGKVGVSSSNLLGSSKRKNYTTSKNRKNIQGKLELRKYCPFERKHTMHKEAKIK